MCAQTAAIPNETCCSSGFGTVFGYVEIYLYEVTPSAGRRRVEDRVAKGVFCIRSGAITLTKIDFMSFDLREFRVKMFTNLHIPTIRTIL